MSELMPCPHQGCKSGKVHCLVGFDIFWNDCPMCEGLGYVKRPGSTSTSKRDQGQKNEQRIGNLLAGGGQWHVDHLITDSSDNNNVTASVSGQPKSI